MKFFSGLRRAENTGRDLNKRRRRERRSSRRLLFDRFENRCMMAVGDLDTSFSDDGYAVVGLSSAGAPTNDFGLRVESQQTLEGGKALVIAQAGSARVMFRLNADGSVDDTFGSGPEHTVNPSIGIADLAIDGEMIYVLGSSGNTRKVSRYGAHGVLDTSFGVGGLADTGLQAGVNLDPFNNGGHLFTPLFRQPTAHLAVTAQGIVVATNSTELGFAKNTIKLTRLRPTDQQVDPTFGNNGIAIAAQFVNTPFPDEGFLYHPVLQELAVRNDRVVALATIRFESHSEFSSFQGVGYVATSVLSEFDASGTSIAQFDQHGRPFTKIERPLSTAEGLQLGMDNFEPMFMASQGGQVVAAGKMIPTTGLLGGLGLRRYNADGTIDYSFGTAGSVMLDEVTADGSPFDFDHATSLTVQADGKLIVGGRAGLAGAAKILRLTPDGALDTTFGGDGYVPATTNGTAPPRAVVDTTGNVLVVGTRANGVNGSDVEVSRLIGNVVITPQHTQAARIKGLRDVFVGERMAVTVGATDPNPVIEDQGFDYVIDWGDGSSPTIKPMSRGNGSGVNVDHVYANVGLYTIKVTATNINDEVTPEVSTPASVVYALERRGDVLVGGTTGSDTITLSDTSGQVAVTVNSSAAGLFSVGRILAVFPNGGSDTFNINSVGAEVYGTDSAVADTVAVNASGSAGLYLALGAGPDAVTIHSMGSGGANLDGQEGTDTYTVNFGALAGSVFIGDTGAIGSDALFANGSIVDEDFFKAVDSTTGRRTIDRSAPTVESVVADGIEAATLNGGPGDDNITDPGEDTTILGGPGNDTIVINATFGSGVAVDGGDGSDSYVIGGVDLHGPVSVSDSGTSGTDDVTIVGTPDDDQFTQTETGIIVNDTPITFGVGLETAAVEGGGGSDQVVAEAAPPIPIQVQGVSDMVVSGTAGNDHIHFSPGAIAGEVIAKLNGVAISRFSPTGRIIAFGQAGDDDIQIAGSIALTAEFYGGRGDDRLKGGAANDLLFGGEGDDLLVGGQGRDLLVGGSGADRIVGNSDDDILIAGTTAFDLDHDALCAIMDEWTSDRDYAVRVANLRGTGSGPSFEARQNANYFLSTDGPTPTVYDDEANDVMTGSQGQDWFFANLETGVLDKITDLHADEFEPDMDFILSE